MCVIKNEERLVVYRNERKERRAHSEVFAQLIFQLHETVLVQFRFGQTLLFRSTVLKPDLARGA